MVRNCFLNSLFLFFICTFFSANAQTDTSYRLHEVIISGFNAGKTNNTSLNIEPYNLSKIESKSPYNLSDALAKLPGISQMTTGNAISKPVVRGLYGNRVLVLLSGLRFDNQQWQDEHGLGLSQIGIDRVEIIRGPASLLYGTDAIGGVINVIEATPLKGERIIDINTRLYSNTRGTLTDIGYANYKGGLWWRLRGGIESHADYSDGAGNRVNNSRNKGYYAKAGFGFDHPHWSTNNAYNFSYNQFGFILEDLNLFFIDDGRWSRNMENPHHNVMLNTFSSQNSFYLNRKSTDDAHQGSLLKLNVGVQSNRRAEDEGSGNISLDMHLLSYLENARYEKYISQKSLFILNQQFTFENNTNYGKRILIPDASMFENNFSLLFRHTSNRLILEMGAGGTIKDIHTSRTGMLNAPGTSIRPFNISKPAANGMLGICYNINNHEFIKANIATGTRTGNLAELASNGVHEGTFRYEIGDPKLKSEQNINTDFSYELSTQQFFLSVSAYYNRFYNYIYLMPTSEDYYGYQVFRYKQQDAKIYGSEISLAYTSEKKIIAKETFSVIHATSDDGNNLPFIPAWRSVTSFRYEKNWLTEWRLFYVEPELEYVFAQNNLAQFETKTSDYALVHLHAGIITLIAHHEFDWNLTCSNLFDKKYADHLSRLKYYGLYNEGRNFILSVSTKFGK